MPTGKAGGTRSAAREKALRIRPLAASDLAAIVALDRAVVGRSRRGFYERRLAHFAAEPGAFVALGAELGGRLVGFAFARLYEGEFGRLAPEASLDAIGVDAKVRRRGIGRELIEAMAEAMRLRGIKELSTQAVWTEADLIGFFARADFAPAPRIVLERSVEETVAL